MRDTEIQLKPKVGFEEVAVELVEVKEKVGRSGSGSGLRVAVKGVDIVVKGVQEQHEELPNGDSPSPQN